MLLKRALLLIVFLPLLGEMAQPSSTGCTDASQYTDVPSALAQAEASTSKCLYLPTGMYPVGSPTSGAWLNATADRLEIRGDGEGKSILRITSPLTLTSDLAVLRLFGVGQSVHDLTIDLGVGHTGAGNLAGISIYGSGGQGSFAGRAERSTIERVEVFGGYTATGAGGYGIGTYRLYSDQGGAQWVTVRDCYIHDSPSTAIGVNSSQNALINNRILRVGTNTLSHGFYAQGGSNLYEGNIVESATGYSFHGHKQVPSLDGSGDRYIGNTSINPGAGHLVINSAVNGSNPNVPTGAPLTRYATIENNVFRNTGGHRTPNAIWCNGVPCLIEGNTLEDTYTTTGAGWIEDTGGSVITGNLLTTLVAPDGAVNYAMIRAQGIAGSTITNNRLTNGYYGRGIVVYGARHSIQNNTVLTTANPGTDALQLSGDMLLATGNRLESTGGSYVLSFTAPLPTNLTFTGNYMRRPSNPLFSINLTGVTGTISANIYDGQPIWSGNGAGVLR